jgi:hypothetical protein
MPSPLPRQVQWSLFARLSPLPAAFPLIKQDRLLQLFFRGLLNVSFTLRFARSRSRQTTLHAETSDSFLASAAASIASTGWSEPVPGREFSPAEGQRLSQAHFMID